MADPYSSAARGIEAGFSMGRQAALDEESKRARKVQEDRQAADDVRRAEGHELDTQRARFGIEQAQKTAARQEDTRMEAVLDGEISEIEKTQAARRAQGLDTDPAAAARYAELKTGKAKIRQAALDYWSRAKTGQIDPMSVPGPELRMHMTAATGMLPEDLPGVKAGAADIEAGMETANWGLVTQGVNKAMVSQLRRGVGGESPYGGTITRKEIIGLDPAIDAAGNEHPNRFIPRMRVYVGGVSPTGEEMYYDAPMTQNGSTDPNDKVVAIDIKKGMDWLANVKMLAEMAERPDMKAKLTENDNGAAKRYIDELNAVTAPKSEPVRHVVLPAGARLASIYRDGSTDIAAEGAAAPPKSRTVDRGGKKITQEWDAASGTWKDIAEAPRWKGGAGGGGGASPALGGAAAPSKPDDAVEFWARAVIAGDKDWQVGLARSKTGSDLIEKVKRRVPVLAKEMGLDPQDIGTARAQSAALGATLKELTKRSEAIQLFSSKTEKDMATFEQIAHELQRTNPTIVSKPINAVRRALSDTDQARLDLAARQMATEYERLINGGALSVAQLPVAARLGAAKLINGDMPLDQALAVTRVMRAEMVNAKTAALESQARVTQQLRGLGRGVPGAPAPAPGAAPAAGGTGLPARPAGVAPTARYSPSRNEWWDGGRKVWPAQ